MNVRLATLLLALPAALAAQAPEVSITRLDCGGSTAPADVGRFNDAFALGDLKLQLVYSCYVIRHGDDYLVWDTGMPPGTPAGPKVGLADLLTQMKVDAAKVKYVGISHYHGDHTGQVSALPNATLLIGKGDWDAISATPPAGGAATTTNFARWLTGGGKVEPQATDKDVFGDGTVVMINLPGHTPGHHSLLVRLKGMGPVLISGDLTHFRENYAIDGVPTFNTDRAASLASIDRFKKIAASLKATVIIQHDPRDISKLPAFPAAAK